MKIAFEINRRLTDGGAWGILIDLESNSPFAVTLEHTYAGMQPKIPDGLWYCSKTIFHKRGYETFEVHIPNHTRILFHKGNFEDDSEGCILVAENFADFDPAPGIQKPAIADSKGGFGEFMDLAKPLGDGFFLKVVSYVTSYAV